MAGMYQSTNSGHTCLWNRDKNAACNMVKVYRSIADTGLAPIEFRRTTPKENVQSDTQWSYARRADPGSLRLRRWKTPRPADPAPAAVVAPAAAPAAVVIPAAAVAAAAVAAAAAAAAAVAVGGGPAVPSSSMAHA